MIATFKIYLGDFKRRRCKKMNVSLFILALLMIPSAYLIGSIATGYIVFKKKTGKDIRNFGSGSTGGSNVLRLLGKKWGLSVILLDALKGFLPTLLALCLVDDRYAIYVFNGLIPALTGFAAILGHVYSCLVPKPKFKAGKSVAITFGVTSAIFLYYFPFPWDVTAIVTTFGAWLIAEKTTKKASIASLTLLVGIITNTVIIWYRTESPYSFSMIIIVLAVFLVLWTHKENWPRVWKGEERETQI
ncbi:MAG: glycerol-3-phosphate acyltransferase [Patescibacteria group bacterium]